MKKKHGEQAAAAATQLRGQTDDVFGALRSLTPLGGAEERLYRAMRESIPLLDAAIGKLVRLCGGFTVECAQKQRALNEFLRTVPCGYGQYGVHSFLAAYLDSLLTYGRAIGEMVEIGRAHV